MALLKGFIGSNNGSKCGNREKNTKILFLWKVIYAMVGMYCRANKRVVAKYFKLDFVIHHQWQSCYLLSMTLKEYKAVFTAIRRF